MKYFLVIVVSICSLSISGQSSYTVNTVSDFSDFTCGTSSCPDYLGSGSFCFPNSATTSYNKISRYFWISCSGANVDSVVFSYMYKSNNGSAINLQIQTDLVNSIFTNTVITFTAPDSGIVRGKWVNFPVMIPLVFNVIVTKLGPTSNNFCLTIKKLVVKAYCAGVTYISESDFHNDIVVWSFNKSIFFHKNLVGKKVIIQNNLGQVIYDNFLEREEIELEGYTGIIIVNINGMISKHFIESNH